MKKALILLPILFLAVGCSSDGSQNNRSNRTFTVSFLNYNGNMLYQDSVRYGGTAVYSGPTPTKESVGYTSYVFRGWDKDLDNVTRDFTTMAQFDEVQDESDPEYTNCSLKMVENGEGYDIKYIYSCKSHTKMILPDYYNGKPVISIGHGRNANTTDDVFSSTCGGMTEIKFPAHLKEIGYEGMYRYEAGMKFVNLEFPDELESIGGWAFRSISTLQSVRCNSNLKRIDDLAFFGSGKLTSLTLSRNLQSIGREAFRAAFADSASISIYIPRSCTSIGEKAFYDTYYQRLGYGDYEEVPVNLTFYCEAESKPSGWDEKWNWYGDYQYYNQPAPAYQTHWGVPFPY